MDNITPFLAVSLQTQLTPRMTQQQLSLEVVWGTLLEGMVAVFAQQQMNKKQYMNLYTLVYNYCTNVSASNHFNVPRTTILHSRNTSRTKLARGSEQDSFVGQDLYSKIRDYFTTHLESLLSDRLTLVSHHASSSEEILQVEPPVGVKCVGPCGLSL